MIEKTLRLLRGTLSFQAENGFPETFLSACGKEEYPLFAIHATETGISARCYLSNFPQIKQIAERYGVSLTIERERGIIRFLRKHKRRFLLPLGLLLAITFLFFSQDFLWTIEVSGNRTVSASAIEAVLSEEGVTKMTYLPSLDFRILRETLLLKLPQLSFLTINRYGSRLEVIVAERALHESLKDETPCDVIARYDGIIRSIDVYEGKETTGIGYPVEAGEILVHGHYQTKKGDILLVHADARIIAEVYPEKTIALDLNEVQKAYSGETQILSSLYFFDFQIPLSFGNPASALYDSTDTQIPLNLFGMEFPIGIRQETRTFYETIDRKTAKENAEAILRRAFLQYEADELADHAILSREETVVQNGDLLIMRIRYVTECDIAKQVEVTLQDFKTAEQTN